MNIIRTIGALVYRNDEVLLVKHRKKAEHQDNSYGLPAGRLENGESPEDTCLRELVEETGLIGRRESLVKLPKNYTADIKRKDGVKRFSLEIYICQQYTGELRATEETTPEWIKISEIASHALLPNVAEIVNEGLRFR